MEDFWQKRLFTWMDYLFFGMTLLLSALIGIYYAWRGSNSSTFDYLLAGKKMSVFPVAMSLAASSLSATTLLGVPTEVYFNGTMYVWYTVSAVFSIAIASYLYLPVYHRLQLISANQFLQIRFHPIIRRLASVLFMIKQLLYLSIVAYGPSLALRQVTGIDAYVSVAILFAVCTFYTAIGGIKAVIWTDTIQIILMYGSIITLVVRGVLVSGGLENVWERSYNSSRIELLNYDIDPTVPHTVWSMIFGSTFYWLSWYAVDQTVVQRFLVIPSLRSAQLSMWSNLVAVCGILILCACIGLVIYSKYFDCDPFTAQLIDKADQIVPFFIMDVLGSIPGLPGLFVAGVFSGALSTLSSVLNAVALIALEDLIRPLFPNIQEQTAVRLVKGVSLLFSVLSFSMVFLVSQVKSIFDATLSLDGAVAGSLLGVFSLGIFVPSSNAIGAGVGMIASFVIMMWLGISAQIAKSNGIVVNSQLKSLRTDNCPLSNRTFLSTDSVPKEEVFVLLRISYVWYSMIGTIIVLILGTITSLITKAKAPQPPNEQLEQFSHGSKTVRELQTDEL